MCDDFLNKIFHCTFNATSPLCTPVQQLHGWLVYFQAKNQTMAQCTYRLQGDKMHTPRQATTECQFHVYALDPWWVPVSNLSFPVEWSKIEILDPVSSYPVNGIIDNPVLLSNSSSLHDLILSPGVMVNLWIMIQLSHDIKCDMAKIWSPSEKDPDNSHRRILDRDRCHALNRCFILTFCEAECAPNITPSNFTILTLSYLDSDNNTFY